MRVLSSIHKSTSWLSTRGYFEQQSIDLKQVQRKRLEQEVKKKKQQIFGLISNDKNPNNFIKNVRINQDGYNYFDNKKISNQVNSCAILTPQPYQPPVLFSAIRKYMITSIKKAKVAMRPIRRQYLYDAIARLQGSHKKVAKLMLPTLFNLVRHAVEKGRDPLRLYIYGALIGKTKRYKLIRYHAKGRHGLMKRDYCQIRIVVQQKRQQQFYEKVGAGESPPGFAQIIRYRLKKHNESYQKLQEMSSITTARGRQQKKQIIRRRVYRIMSENKNKNVYVPKKTVIKQIRKQEGIKIKQLIQKLGKKSGMSRLKKRQEVFKKNMDLY